MNEEGHEQETRAPLTSPRLGNLGVFLLSEGVGFPLSHEG